MTGFSPSIRCTKPLRDLQRSLSLCKERIQPSSRSGRNRFRRLMILPATMNTPSPVKCNVWGCFSDFATCAFTIPKTKKLYRSTSVSSAKRHSKLACHSAIMGTLTSFAGSAVRPNVWIFSTRLATGSSQRFPRKRGLPTVFPGTRRPALSYLQNGKDGR